MSVGGGSIPRNRCSSSPPPRIENLNGGVHATTPRAVCLPIAVKHGSGRLSTTQVSCHHTYVVGRVLFFLWHGLQLFPCVLWQLSCHRCFTTRVVCYWHVACPCASCAPRTLPVGGCWCLRDLTRGWFVWFTPSHGTGRGTWCGGSATRGERDRRGAQARGSAESLARRLPQAVLHRDSGCGFRATGSGTRALHKRNTARRAKMTGPIPMSSREL